MEKKSAAVTAAAAVTEQKRCWFCHLLEGAVVMGMASPALSPSALLINLWNWKEA